jgi:hypothetical protein
VSLNKQHLETARHWSVVIKSDRKKQVERKKPTESHQGRTLRMLNGGVLVSREVRQRRLRHRGPAVGMCTHVSVIT